MATPLSNCTIVEQQAVFRIL